MDFTTDKRIEKKKRFINIKNSNRKNFFELFEKKYVGKGVESIVYRGKYKNGDLNITIKIVDLKKLRKGKIKLLDYTIEKYIQLRDTNIIFKEHRFIASFCHFVNPSECLRPLPGKYLISRWVY